MNPLVLHDEFIMCAGLIQKTYSSMYKSGYRRKFPKVVCVGDGSRLTDYLMYALAANNAKKPIFKKCEFFGVKAPGFADVERSVIDKFIHVKKPSDGKGAFFFVSSCKKASIEQLSQVFEHMRKYRGSRCIVTLLLPKYPYFPGEIEKMAEREFDYFIEKECACTPEIGVYLQLMEMCREAVAEDNLNISVVRFSNVFGPDFVHMPGFALDSIFKDFCDVGRVLISDSDYAHQLSLAYVRDACYYIFKALGHAKKGHVYNADGVSVSLYSLKKLVHTCAPSRFALSIQLSADVPRESYALSALKLKKTGIILQNFLTAGMKHYVSYHSEVEYDTSDSVAFYCGKINTIQALELEILKKIDAICRENDIKYFLAGGTLLGAVRSGGFIPWDDDLDIGMLREDFEKFRKVCKGKLEGDFLYSCGETGNHYTIDKIRLDDTYFSTNFSKKNVFSDGIFVDLLIYDRTSNRKVMQRLHSWVLTVLTTLIYIRWYNTPRKNYHYRFSKLFLPLLRLIPWKVYHGLFDFCAGIYRNKKDAKWLIDSVGKKVHGAPLPNKGLDEVTYVDFAGMQAPIPVDPHPYLNYAYGPTYMQMPPLSKRCCPHNFARIDLGRYVLGYENAKPFRKVDIRGELYEREDICETSNEDFCVEAEA